jgi:type IV pilus assembly protein PilB
LLQAMSVSASDIHVEPQQAGLRLRYRQDGVLQQYIEPLPARLIPAVTSRFKILADLDIAERRQAQDGRIRRRYKDQTIDFRVNTLPSRFGEKICLRLLDSNATQLGLDKLISDPEALALIRDLGSKPFGMILVTGPTGSGKSTTLYSLLAERNDPGINISTVEDPIEYTLPGITQCQVNREKDFDFATALRAFMRQDPDVLLVGETRDLETAKTAIEAALTGHLVLSTLHANDASSTIARLDEMGVEPFMVSASLIGIISQRLLRRVCDRCKEAYRPEERELGRFGLMASREANVTFFKAHHHQQQDTACPDCKGSGYRGRVGVYEVLRVHDDMATAISRGASTDVIRQMALESGMVTLLGYSLELVRQGHTTLEEVGRMILTDSGLESERRARALSTMTCEGCGAGLQEGWLECPYCLTERH